MLYGVFVDWICQTLIMLNVSLNSLTHMILRNQYVKFYVFSFYNNK